MCSSVGMCRLICMTLAFAHFCHACAQRSVTQRLFQNSARRARAHRIASHGKMCQADVRLRVDAVDAFRFRCINGAEFFVMRLLSALFNTPLSHRPSRNPHRATVHNISRSSSSSRRPQPHRTRRPPCSWSSQWKRCSSRRCGHTDRPTLPACRTATGCSR